VEAGLLQNVTTELTNGVSRALQFIKKNIWLFLITSTLLVVPCIWHRHIEAGDLASHVYNAWLAQLIQKGQAPGLYLAPQWNNVLLDVSLLRVASVAGFSAAEKTVVSTCVLIFFWGVFALISTTTGRSPWFLAPCIAMLAYGYTFNMGFLNYYLSLGLACFGLALLWRGNRIDWVMGAFVVPLVLLAHPIGFLWLLGSITYAQIRSKLTSWWRLAPAVIAVGSFVAIHWYLAHRAKLALDWPEQPVYFFNGADQLVLYGPRYIWLAGAAFAFGVLCFAVHVWQERKSWLSGNAFVFLLELYLVAFCATSLLPENLRPSIYAGWIGLLVSRLTTISAIFGLCIMGYLKPRNWQALGFSACAVVFFILLYEDTSVLNRMEASAEKLVSELPYGTRVVPIISAAPDSRIQFIGHSVDRACIGHCFTYSNYEASSRQFRVRVEQGSPVVTSSADDAEDMQGGSYEVQETDLPLKVIYQCDPADGTKLCLRDLAEGETTGNAASHAQN